MFAFGDKANLTELERLFEFMQAAAAGSGRPQMRNIQLSKSMFVADCFFFFFWRIRLCKRELEKRDREEVFFVLPGISW
jgi:hypothetical protein